VLLETRDREKRLVDVIVCNDVREVIGVNDAQPLVVRVKDGDMLEDDVVDIEGETEAELVWDALPEALRDNRDDGVTVTDAVLLDEAATDRDDVIDARVVFDELILDDELTHAIGEFVGDMLDTKLGENFPETLGLGENVAEMEGTEELLTENVFDGVKEPHGDADCEVDTVGECVVLSDAV
jgi:hypothetical protein